MKKFPDIETIANVHIKLVLFNEFTKLCKHACEIFGKV